MSEHSAIEGAGALKGNGRPRLGIPASTARLLLLRDGYQYSRKALEGVCKPFCQGTKVIKVQLQLQSRSAYEGQSGRGLRPWWHKGECDGKIHDGRGRILPSVKYR